MMSNIILKDIRELNNLFNRGGVTLDFYFKRKKQIRKKIDLLGDENLKIFQLLYFCDLISHQQYMEMKNKVEQSRGYYKRLLS